MPRDFGFREKLFSCRDQSPELELRVASSSLCQSIFLAISGSQFLFALLSSVDSVVALQLPCGCFWDKCMHPVALIRRPTQTADPAVSFIFTGRGTALLVRHNILQFLYHSQHSSSLAPLTCASFAIAIVTGRWTQVDTPSTAQRSTSSSDDA